MVRICWCSYIDCFCKWSLFWRSRLGCSFSWLNIIEDCCISLTCLANLCLSASISRCFKYTIWGNPDTAAGFMDFILELTMSLIRFWILGAWTRCDAFCWVSVLGAGEAALSFDRLTFCSFWRIWFYSSFTTLSQLSFPMSMLKIEEFRAENCSRDFLGEFLGVCETWRWSWSSADGMLRDVAGWSWLSDCLWSRSTAMFCIMEPIFNWCNLLFWIIFIFSEESFKLCSVLLELRESYLE